MASGLLGNLTDGRLTEVLTALTRQRDTAEIASLIVLAPFRRVTWSFVETLGGDIDAAYWSDTPIVWSQARAACAELGRDEVCDFQIGKLFSKAPVGEDGIWPCEPVREVIERVATARLCEGVRNGLYNSRGAHWRGPRGDQERQLATRYAAWALALEFKYANVANILKGIVRTYEHEGNLHDIGADVRKRLLR
jgi:hypothetical protein